jgi:hypothetical protein
VLTADEAVTKALIKHLDATAMAPAATATPIREPADDAELRLDAPPAPAHDVPELFGAIREHFTPHAVAAIVSCLRLNQTNSPDVDRQIEWFEEQLLHLLGGGQRQSQLVEELGL